MFLQAIFPEKLSSKRIAICRLNAPYGASSHVHSFLLFCIISVMEEEIFKAADFLVYCIITAYTPGPNNLLSMSYASSLGLRKSFHFNLGISMGFFIVMSACAIFTSALSTLIPKIELPLKILGAAYMLYLGWKIFKSTEAGPVDGKHGATFLSGMMLQFVNVKIYIYAITAFSLYVLPVYSSVPMLFLFVIILTLIGASGNYIWAFFGNALCSFTKRHGKAVNTVMALLLAYCAISLFL